MFRFDMNNLLKLNKLFQRAFVFALVAVMSLTFLTSSCSKKKDIDDSNKVKKVSKAGKVTIYLTKASDELGVILIPVVRPVAEGRTMYETAVRELFLGPTIEEQEKLDLWTEIPEGCRLIDVEENDKSVRINISSQFMSGGGSESMQVRFRQLRETSLNLAKGRPVYLYMDGKKAKTIGGEGLEIPQPFNP